MKSLMTTIAALGFACAAHAATTIQSEFFYQADSDSNVLTPEVNYNSTSVKYKGLNKTEATGQVLDLSYERGLNEMYSVGAGVGYMTGKQEQKGSNDQDTSGLKDLSLFARGRYAFVEDSSLHYGADVLLSTGDKETEDKASKTEVNASTGGNSIRPYVGYQWLLGSHVLGTKLSTDFNLGKKSLKSKSVTGTTTTSKEEGGEETTLSVFYEIPHEMGSVGFQAFYTGVANTKTDSTKNTDGYNQMGLGVYSPYHFSESAAVIGDLTWSQLASSSIGGVEVDSTSDINVSVAGRFMF